MGDRLKDKVAIVVGAGSSGPGWGNGKATAVTFAREGARVFCVDANVKAAQETVEIIKGEGGEAHAHLCNVANAAEVQRMAEACATDWGRIDVLHNNVGIARTGGPVEMSEGDWDLVLDVNLKSFFLTCKYVLPIMEKQGAGSIINVSSIASIRVPRGISYVAYNASKAGVNGLTQAVAVQYASRGIRCNAILPGLMNTPMIAPLASSYSQGDYEKMIAIRDKISPTGKMGTAWDVANCALFLASDESKYVNGHLLVVDGGLINTA